MGSNHVQAKSFPHLAIANLADKISQIITICFVFTKTYFIFIKLIQLCQTLAVETLFLKERNLLKDFINIIFYSNMVAFVHTHAKSCSLQKSGIPHTQKLSRNQTTHQLISLNSFEINFLGFLLQPSPYLKTWQVSTFRLVAEQRDM